MKRPSSSGRFAKELLEDGPQFTDRVSHAMTLRVADCQAAYEALRSRGAEFLTPPHDWGAEVRCFLRDPDGHLVEISEAKAG